MAAIVLAVTSPCSFLSTTRLHTGRRHETLTQEQPLSAVWGPTLTIYNIEVPRGDARATPRDLQPSSLFQRSFGPGSDVGAPRSRRLRLVHVGRDILAKDVGRR